MTVKIKKLVPPLPYAKIGDLFYKTYFQNYKDAGALQWNEKYAEIYFTSWVIPKSDELIIGAWDDEKLVGLTVGHKEDMLLDNEIEIKSANIGLTAVLPDYQKQGIATNLVKNLMDEAKKLNLDMIHSMAQKGRYGDKIYKNLDFIKMGKHDHMIKIMEKYGVNILKEYRGLNPLLAKLAEKLYSKIPDYEVEGTFRRGKMTDDVPRCIEIYNSYTSRVPLSRIYSEDTFKKDIEGSIKLNDLFGDPWGMNWMVLDIDGKIMATITCRIEMTTFENGSAPVALLGNLGFDGSLEQDQKDGFLATLIRFIRDEYPEVFTCQITSWHHEQKAIKNLSFTDDQDKYIFFMYPFTDNAREIDERYKKLKEFNLSYYR
jgi:GNAT superfamily N-acetyltransferase